MRVLIIFTILSIFIINCLEYKKNSDILNSPKRANHRIIEIDNSIDISNRILNKKNFTVLFHTDWCHHCKVFLPIFKTASEYDLTSSLEFISVNCQNKNVCDSLGISGYPNIKVYINGKFINYETPRQLEPLLEYFDKLLSPLITPVDESQINHFSNFYGEVSFLVVSKDDDSNFMKCIKQIANDYLPYLYFGHLKKIIYTTKSGLNLTSPSIFTLGVNENYNLNYIGEETSNCEQIREFIEINEFPMMNRLNQKYISRLLKHNKTFIVSIVNFKSQNDIRFLVNTFQTIALENRGYIFAYMDLNEDKDLIANLKLENNLFPKVFIYVPDIKRIYVDEFIYNEENLNMVNLELLINKLKKGEIIFKSSFWLIDLIEMLGIPINKRTLTYFCIIIFLVVILLFILKYEKKEINEISKNKSE